MTRLAALFLALAGSAQGGDRTPAIPLRYQGLHQTRLLELRTVLGHPEQTPAFGHTAVLSRDGRLGLFAGGGGSDIDGKTDESFLSVAHVLDGDARLQGSVVREIRIPGKAITCLALSPDGKRALTGLYANDGKNNESTELALWSLETGAALHRFAAPKAREKERLAIYIAIAFAPDGKSALATTSSGVSQHLDLDAGKLGVEFRPGNEEGEASLAVVFVSPTQAAIGWGSAIHLWDLVKKESLAEFKGHKDDVVSLTVSDDGKSLASSGVDDAIRVWDLVKRKEVAVLQRGPGNQPLITTAFTGKGREVLSVWTGNDPMTGLPADASIVLWDADARKERWSKRARLHGLAPIGLRRTKDEWIAVLGGGSNLFMILDAGGSTRAMGGGHKSPVTALAAGAGSLISGSQEGHLAFWEKNVPRHVAGHGDAIFTFSPIVKGRFLSGGADRLVKLWDVKKAEPIRTFAGHEGNVTGVAFGPDQKWIASAGGDRVIRTWSTETGKPIEVLSGHADAINALAVSPGGNLLATAADDNTVRLWPMVDGKLRREPDAAPLEGHKRQATCLAFTPDGKHLISGSQDKTLRVWDVAKEKTVKILEGHQNWITSVLVWNDKIVSTADDFRVLVWDLNTGKIVDSIDLTPYGDCPRSLALTEDGRGFYVGTSGWVVMRFELLK